jgi:fructokinase
MEKTVVGLGEALWDCLPNGSKLGGAPANFAYHASQFGLEAYAVSAVGNDALGDQTREELREKHLRHILPVVPFPTGTVQVELDAEGVPTYDIRQNVAWDNIPYTPEMDKLAQRSEGSRETILRFLEATKKDCLKIFDINLRQNFYTKEIIQDSLRACNVLKINDEELVTLGRLYGYPGLDMENKCWLILGKYNLKMLVLTCGTNGSYVFAADHMSFQPTPKVEVADTVGAGDSFTGAFAASVLSGMPVADAHKVAVEVSAYVCTQPGAMPVLPESLTQRVK